MPRGGVWIRGVSAQIGCLHQVHAWDNPPLDTRGRLQNLTERGTSVTPLQSTTDFSGYTARGSHSASAFLSLYFS